MTNKDKINLRKLEKPDYEVGYGKPPTHSRFKPGQSGNPRGRPWGSKNKQLGLPAERLKEIILDEAYRDISVHDVNRHAKLTPVLG